MLMRVRVEKFNEVRVYVFFMGFICTSSWFICDKSVTISCQRPQRFSLYAHIVMYDQFSSVQNVRSGSVVGLYHQGSFN